MLDDSGFEQDRRQRRAVENHQVVVEPHAVAGIGRIVLQPVPVRCREARPAQHRAHRRGAAQAGFQVRVLPRHEQPEASFRFGISLRLAFPFPRQEPALPHRIVVNRNEKATAGSRFRTGGETGDAAIEIDGGDLQTVGLNPLPDLPGQFEIEDELGAAAGADGAGVGQRMADVDGDRRLRRRQSQA